MLSPRFCICPFLIALLGGTIAFADPPATQPAEAAAAAPVTTTLPKSLDPQPWREFGYGLSLHPPRDVQATAATSDGALVNFLVPEVGNISVNIHHTDERMAVEQVIKRAGEQLGYRFPSAVEVHRRALRPGGRPGGLVVFKVLDPERGDWVLAMAVMRIDPYTYASIELTCPEPQLEAALPTFMDVLSSITLLPPAELEKQRTVLLKSGDDLLAQFSPQRLSAWVEAEQDAAPTGRWYRVLQDGKDVGGQLVQVQATGGPRDGKLRFLIRSRIESSSGSFDTVAEYTETMDGDSETWSVVTTQRDAKGVGVGAGAGAEATGLRPSDNPITRWAETGVRGMLQLPVRREGRWVAGDWTDAIKVTREGGGHKPQGDGPAPLASAQPDVNQWATPEVAYLSQPRAELLGAMLRGATQPRTYAFYSYYGPTKRVALRFVQMRPMEDGTYLVMTRPDPHRGVRMSQYNARGELLRERLGDGRELVPSTAEEVEAIWRAKGS